MSLTREGLNRLVFLRGVITRATGYAETAGQQSVDRTTSLLLLDYAAQGFLYLVLSEIGRPTSFPGPQAGYFNKMSQLSTQNLSGHLVFPMLCDSVTAMVRSHPEWQIGSIPHLQELRQLHESRNDVQHHFTIPSTDDLHRYQVYVFEACTKLARAIFDVDFGALGYHALVSDKVLRARLLAAEDALQSEDFVATVDNCAVAVEEAILRRAWAFPKYRLKDLPGDRLTPQSPDQHPAFGDTAFVFTWLQFVAVGINQADAERFYLMAPSVGFSASGIPWLHGARTDLKREDAEFALHFAASVVTRFEQLGLASYHVTGEWVESDERQRIQRRVPNWNSERLTSLQEAIALSDELPNSREE